MVLSTLTSPDPVKLVAAVFSADSKYIETAAMRIEEFTGPLDYAGAPEPFDQTDYYRPEMGGPLVKRLFAVEKLIDPAELVEIKIKCVDLEKEMSIGGKRTVNMDPGYVGVDKFVLSTGKPAAHRIYLGKGVWAEVTMVYQSGCFIELPWTYPDYASEPIVECLTDIRKKYLEQMRSGRQESK